MKMYLKIILLIIFGLSVTFFINQILQGKNRAILDYDQQQLEEKRSQVFDGYTESRLSIVSKGDFSTSIVVNNIKFVDYFNKEGYSDFRRALPFQQKHNSVILQGSSGESAKINITVNEEVVFNTTVSGDFTIQAEYEANSSYLISRAEADYWRHSDFIGYDTAVQELRRLSGNNDSCILHLLRMSSSLSKSSDALAATDKLYQPVFVASLQADVISACHDFDKAQIVIAYNVSGEIPYFLSPMIEDTEIYGIVSLKTPDGRILPFNALSRAKLESALWK